jgi:hypothetical protein
MVPGTTDTGFLIRDCSAGVVMIVVPSHTGWVSPVMAMTGLAAQMGVVGGWPGGEPR